MTLPRIGRRAALAATAAAVLGRPALAQTVELEFPTWQAEETGTGPFWSAVAGAFEAAHPGVRIKKYAVPLRDYVDKMTTRFAAGQPPDIVHLPTRSVAAYAAQGWLLPLDPMLAETDIPAHWSRLQSELSHNGRTMGVLIMAYGMLLYYNEALLHAAALPVPETPDALLTAIGKTTDADKGVFGWGATTAEHPNVYVDWATWTTGEGVSFYRDGRYNFTDPAVVASMDRFRTALRHAPRGQQSEATRQLFLNGKVALMRDGPWLVSQMRAASAAAGGLRAAMMPFPNIPGGTSNSLHIPAKADPARRDLAWAFIRLATSPEWCARYTLETRNPSARRDSAPAAQVAAVPDLRLVMEAASRAVNLYPELPAAQLGYDQIARLTAAAGLRLINSNRGTAEVLAELQANLEKRVPLA